MKHSLVFSFDFGTASLAECVRSDSDVKHLETILFPADFASVAEDRKKRRQYRTRMSHKAREEWWRKKAKEIGLEVLETAQPSKNNPYAKPDPRMLREFSSEGDNTIYNSSLLRIALLQGIKLEGWQIFKAIRSAIQRRGYDNNPPWKNGADEEVDDQENTEGVSNYLNFLKTELGNDERYHYPCYVDAYRMGLWTPSQPDKLILKLKTNKTAPARNKEGQKMLVVPRKYVEKELFELLKMVSKTYPLLNEDLIKEIVYGKGKERYAAYNNPLFRGYIGRDKELESLIGQKTPRFNNRIIPKCCLIPRLNACKADDILYKRVQFLIALKNMTYFDKETGEKKRLSCDQMKELYDYYTTKNRRPSWSIYLKKINAVPNPNQDKIADAKKGRAKFSRPSLRILEELLVSGKSPHVLYEKKCQETINDDPRKGLVKKDFEFLLRMPEEWGRFQIPDQREADASLAENERDEKIKEIFSSITNPIVRHRLSFLVRRLKKLASDFGTPDKVVLELVRESDENFSGGDRKKRYLQAQKENKTKKEQAIKDINGKVIGKKQLLKIMLLKDQGGRDVYSGEGLVAAKLDDYEIDHIVPREAGGPDSYINKVLTTADNNRAKGKRTPFEWLNGTPEWEKLMKRLEEKSCKLHRKTKELILSDNAIELVDKYTQLASTAYVAKLAQRIIGLYFGWPLGVKGSERKILVANGMYTSKVRRDNRLDRILYEQVGDEKFKEMVEKGDLDKKNRENPRHHALDALVISMYPEKHYDESKKRDKFPLWFNDDFCRKAIEKVIPKPGAYEKVLIGETIYALRQRIGDDGKKKYYIVTRSSTPQPRNGRAEYKGTRLSDYYLIESAKRYVKNIFDPHLKRIFEEELDKNPSEAEWQTFIKKYENNTGAKRISVIESEIDEDEYNKATLIAGEYKSISNNPKQFFRDKREHKAQIVYEDDNGRWRVMPVYGYESIPDKLSKMNKISKNFQLFRSGQLVEIREDINSGEIKKGVYVLKTIITASGQAKIESVDGAWVKGKSLNALIGIGKMAPYKYSL